MIRPSILFFVVLLPALLAAEIALADDDLDAEMAQMYKMFPNFKASGGSTSNENTGGIRQERTGEQSTSSQPEMSAIDRTRQEAARRSEEKRRRREDQARQDEEEINRLKQRVANSRNNIEKGLATFAFLAKVDEVKDRQRKEAQADRADEEEQRRKEAEVLSQEEQRKKEAAQHEEQARQEQARQEADKKRCGDGFYAAAFTGVCQPNGQVLKFGKSKEEIQQEQTRLEQERLERERPERERLERVRQEAEEKQRLEDDWARLQNQSFFQNASQGSPAQGQNAVLSQPSPAQQALDNEVDEKAPCRVKCMLGWGIKATVWPLADVGNAIRDFFTQTPPPCAEQSANFQECSNRLVAARGMFSGLGAPGSMDIIKKQGDVGMGVDK